MLSRRTVAAYDRINKRIFWAYPDNGETVETKLNNFLILDIPLQAFYPWKVNDQASSTSSIVGMAFYSGFGATNLELDVTSNSGADDVVTSAGDDVVSTQISTFNIGDPAIVLLIRNGTDNKLTMGGFTDTGFQDWGDTDYTSFAVTGYDFMGDLTRHKNTPFLITYARLTEGLHRYRRGGLRGYPSIVPKSIYSLGLQGYLQYTTTGIPSKVPCGT